MSLSASSIAEASAQGVTVGSILGATSGSTVTLHAQSDANKFQKDGNDIEAGSSATDYETETSHTITLREALTGAGNTPRDTIITITVTNVLEVTLSALTLDNDTCDTDDVQGTTVGAITGATAGSTVTLHAQSVANAFQKDGTDIEVGSAAPLAEGTPTITLRETHADASNSPRDSVIPITVAAADITAPTITSADSASVDENQTLSHALTADESVTWSIRTAAQDGTSVDHDKFEISGSTLRWAGNGTKDHETPDDTGTNNTYVVVVRATDLATNTADQTITITVNDVVELGDELIINGDCSSSTGWTFDDGGGPTPTIAGGKLTMDDGDEVGPTANQSPSLDAATTYRLAYTIDSITAGTVLAQLGGVNGTARSAPGSYSEDIISDGSDIFTLTKLNGGVAVMDNFSLREVLS